MIQTSAFYDFHTVSEPPWSWSSLYLQFSPLSPARCLTGPANLISRGVLPDSVDLLIGPVIFRSFIIQNKENMVS